MGNNIIVCIKQVPDTTEVKMDPKTGTLIRDGVPSIVNPFDMYAIEEALRIKERTGRGRVVAISMGPPQAEEALKEAISMGVDDAILISDRAFAGSDTLATSYTLSEAIKKIGDYWVVLFGKQAIDGDTAQVGPGVARWLGIPQVTYVKKIEEINEKEAVVERMTEYGYDRIKVPLPAAFTVVKEINEPRLPSLRGKIRAKNYKVEVFNTQNLPVDQKFIGLNGSPTQVNKIFTPPKRERGEVWHGEPEELAERLANKLKELGLI